MSIEEIEEKVRKAVDNTAKLFRLQPYFFLHEHDLQAELYVRLLKEFNGDPHVMLDDGKKEKTGEKSTQNLRGRQVYTEMYVELKRKNKAKNNIVVDLAIVDKKCITLRSSGKKYSVVDNSKLKAIIELKLSTTRAVRKMVESGNSRNTSEIKILKNGLFVRMFEDARHLAMAKVDDCLRLVVGFHRMEKKADQDTQYDFDLKELLTAQGVRSYLLRKKQRKVKEEHLKGIRVAYIPCWREMTECVIE